MLTRRSLASRHRRLRRVAVAVFLAVGALLMLGSVAAPSGLILLVIGLALEAVGLTLENRGH